MLGWNSMLILWTPMQAQLGSLLRKDERRNIVASVFVFGLCHGLVATLWLVIHIGSLSRQTLDCHDKLSVDYTGLLLIFVATNFLSVMTKYS